MQVHPVRARADRGAAIRLRRRIRSCPAAAALLAGLWFGSTSAHEFWLEPSGFVATPGRPVEIGAVSGTGFRGVRAPFSDRRCVRFLGRAAATLDLRRVASNGDPAWARFAPTDRGGLMVAYESAFTRIELPAREFDAYLANEGLDAPLAARRRVADARPGRERYRRCAKAWLAGSDVRRATAAMGMPLEIVPASMPGAGPALRVRVLHHRRPLAGGLVKAWRTALRAGASPSPETRDSVAVAWQGRTDARGELVVPVREPGVWLLSVVRMVPSRDPAVADWESTWASLTFARDAGAPE